MGVSKQVTEEDKQLLDSEITDEDIAKALKELPSHKSPGGDGLPIDFHHFFWTDIKELVCKSVKLAVSRGELSIEQKRAVLVLTRNKR